MQDFRPPPFHQVHKYPTNLNLAEQHNNMSMPLHQGNGPVMDALKSAGRFIKNNRLISRGLTFAAPYTGEFAPVVLGASGLASSLGYGAPKRRKSHKGGKKKKSSKKK